MFGGSTPLLAPLSRLMPKSLSTIRLTWMALPHVSAPLTITPSPPLCEIQLIATVVYRASSAMITPAPPFPTEPVPAALVPIRLDVTTL